MSQEIEYTVEGRLRVFVDGEVVSEHNQAREAEEAAVNVLLSNPDADVYYTQPSVRVELVGGETEPTPGPEPEPTPEPQPEPTPDPTPEPEPEPEPTPDPPPPSGDLAFESRWPILGKSARALDSDGAWSFMLNNADLMEVVDPLSEEVPVSGFPGNALRVTADNGGRGNVAAAQPQIRVGDGRIPPLSVGDTLSYRYYTRITVPDAYRADPLTHGTQDGNDFGLRNWQHEIVTKGDGTFDLRLSVTNSLKSNAWPDFFWRTNLPKGKTLRIEQQVEIVSQDQFRLHARVYDPESGMLIRDDGDFRNADGSGSLLAEPLHNFGSGGIDSLRALRVGLNSLVGNHPAGTFPFTFAYIGDVAVRVGGWIGE